MRLELTIDEFIRIQLRRVRRQEKELNLVLMFFAPSLNQLCMVYAAVVADDKEFAFCFTILLDQAIEKTDEAIPTNRGGLKTEKR